MEADEERQDVVQSGVEERGVADEASRAGVLEPSVDRNGGGDPIDQRARRVPFDGDDLGSAHEPERGARAIDDQPVAEDAQSKREVCSVLAPVGRERGRLVDERVPVAEARGQDRELAIQVEVGGASLDAVHEPLPRGLELVTRLVSVQRGVQRRERIPERHEVPERRGFGQ